MIIAAPSLGMLNLLGDTAAPLLAQDRADLKPVFGERIEAATTAAPRCDVLFLYCDVDRQVQVLPLLLPLRDLIRQAGARIVVIASELQQGVLNPQFSKVIGPPSDWPANVAFTIERKGDEFGRFFGKLFSLMLTGTDMMSAWVEVAPQGPDQPSNGPVMIMVPEIGQLAFGPPKPALRLV